MNKDKKVLSEWKDEEIILDQKTAKRLVWRARLSIAFTVIRTLFAIFIIYAVYMIAIGMYYHFSGKQASFDRFVTTVIETRHPGIVVDKPSVTNVEITPLLTQKTTMTMYRDVGEWDVVIGNVDAKQSLFGKLKLDFNFDKKYLNESINDSYAIAPDLLGKDIGDTLDAPLILEQLKEISDGYVSQLQFSTRESMKPEALLKLLEKYDVKILEMPVYGGELTEITEGMNFSSDGAYTFTSTLKIRPFVEYDQQHRLSVSYYSLNDEESLESAIEQFPKDLNWLIEHGGYDDRELDEQRLDYIKENQIRVFGAVVTGPIREIERLIEENDFHQFHLGGIEVWNWHSY